MALCSLHICDEIGSMFFVFVLFGCSKQIFFQNKTFTVSCNGKTAGLTLDWNLGFSLHEGDSKTPMWQYKFSQLRGSSDDGKSKLKLHFQDTESRAIETKVIIFLLYRMLEKL